MDLKDRYAADVFQKSYREFRALKPTHFRWSRLAPQSVDWLEQAREQKWSMEKLSDYLHCPVAEAAACLRRYCVSKKVNEMGDTAGRLRQAFWEWTEAMGVADEKARQGMAGELALIVANHLYASALAKEDVLELSRRLENPMADAGKDPAGGKPGGEERTWGPQWKD